jgi:large subunit ribosomal protein L28
MQVLPLRSAQDDSISRNDLERWLQNACRRNENHRIWSKAMAQVCDVCGKGPQFGNNISHAHNVTRRRWNVNLQAVKALVNGAPKRIRVCTSCIKSGKIAKA